MPIVSQHVNVLENILQKHVNKEIDISNHLGKCILDIICGKFQKNEANLLINHLVHVLIYRNNDGHKS